VEEAARGVIPWIVWLEVWGEGYSQGDNWPTLVAIMLSSLVWNPKRSLRHLKTQIG
jgi:hypothetical protein